MATEQTRFPVEELLRSGPPGARAPTPSELRRASGVDARDNLTRQAVHRPAPRAAAAPAPTARTAPQGYTYMGDAASVGPRTDQMRALTDWNDRELQGAGMSRVMKSKDAQGNSVYSNMPGAQGEALFHDMSGNQLNPNDAYNAQRGARRMLSRFGTPQQQRDAALARGEKPTLSPQERIANARMVAALAAAEGEASRAGMDQTLKNLEMQSRPNDAIQQYAAQLQELDPKMSSQDARHEALRWAASNGVGLRDSAIGQQTEAGARRRVADAFNRQIRRGSLGFDQTDVPADIAATATPRNLSGFEHAGRWWRGAADNLTLPGLLGADMSFMGGLPWDTNTAYDVELPDGRTTTTYDDGWLREYLDLINSASPPR